MLKMRRTAAAAAVLLVLLSGCAPGGGLNAPDRKVVIDVIVKKVDADFWKVVQMGAEAAGKEFAVTVNYTGPTDELNIKAQIEMMQAAVDSRPDAIVLAASDYIQLVDVVDKAASANIPVIVIDSDVKSDKTKCFVGTNNVDAGRKLGQSLIDKVGKDCNIAVMGFIQGAATNDQREQGLTEAIGGYPGIRVVSVQYCHSDIDYAKQLTQQLMQKHPDIDAVVCLNAYGTEGAARAMIEMKEGERAKVIGFDSTPNEISYMEKGIIRSLVVQNPYRMGYEGVKFALDAIRGKTLQRNSDTGAKVIFREDMYLPENQKLLFPFIS